MGSNTWTIRTFWKALKTRLRGIWAWRRRLLPSSQPRVRVYVPQTHFGNDPRTRTSVHEAGHALLAWSSACVTEVTAVTITADDDEQSAGHVRFVTPEDVSREDLWEHVAICLAGLAAETVVYDFCQTAAAKNDLEEARAFVEEILRCEHAGAYPDCPWIVDAAADAWSGFIPAHAFNATGRAAEIHEVCYRRALKVVLTHRHRLDAVASALKKKSCLNATEIETLLGPRTIRLFR